MWRLNPKCSLHFRHWGSEWVVFDVGSGQTHEMGVVAAVALMHCENGWVRLDEIAAGIIGDLELPKTTSLTEVLLPLLSQFVIVELLEHRAE